MMNYFYQSLPGFPFSNDHTGPPLDESEGIVETSTCSRGQAEQTGKMVEAHRRITGYDDLDRKRNDTHRKAHTMRKTHPGPLFGL